MSHDELSQYVQMEKMIPKPTPPFVINSQATQETVPIVPIIIPEGICDLRIYSYYFPQIEQNAVCAHLVRTKDKNTREGGVNIGHAFLDT